MADDVNNMNRRLPPPNGSSEIRQIGSDLAQEVKLRAIEEQNLRRRITQNKLILENTPPELFDSIKGTNPGKLGIQIQKDTDSLRSRIGTDLQRRNQQFATQMEKRFSMSSVNGIALEERFGADVAAKSQAMSGMSWDDMQAQRKQIETEVNSMQRQAKNVVRGDPNKGVGGLFTPHTISNPNDMGQSKIYKSLEELDEKRKGAAIQLAAINAQERERRVQGTDPRTREEKTFGFRAAAQREALLNEVKETGKVSTFNPHTGQKEDIALKNVTAELQKAFQDLTKDTQALATATDKEREAIHKRIQGHTDKIDTLQQVNEGRNRKYEQVGMYANAAAGGFYAVGGAIQQIGVTQRMGQISNIAGYANLENQKYDQYKSARAGNMEAAMMLSSWNDTKEFGKGIYGAQQGANTAYLGGAAAQTVAGGVGVAATLNPVENVAATSTAQTNRVKAGLDVVQGVAQGAVIATDMARGVSAGQAEIGAQNTDQSARRELIKVSAEQAQQYRDLAVGSGSVAMGMGSAGKDFLNQVTDQGVNEENMMRSRHGADPRKRFTQRLVDARMSGEQFNQMAQQGSDSMGSMFNTDQIFAARGAERSGLGSTSQNLQRMATLAQVGSNNPKDGLGSVLEAAVAKGLDTSKSIDLMVQNTAAVVQQNATANASGIDVTGATANLLTAGMDPNMANKENALARSMSAKDVAKDIMTNTDVSFSGMVNTSRISRTTGLSGENSIYAAKLSTEQLQTMKKSLANGGSEEDARKALANQGVDVSKIKKGELNKTVDKLLDSSMYTLVEGGGKGFAHGSASERESIVNKMKKGDVNALTTTELSLLGKIGAERGVTGEELFRQGSGVKNAQNQQKPGTPGANDIFGGNAGGDILKTIDDLRTSGFKQLAEQADAANKTLGGTVTALEKIALMNKQLEEVGDKGGEQTFGQAAAKAASTFGNAADAFDKHVFAFGGIVGALAKSAGMKYDPAAALAKEQTDKAKEVVKKGPK